MNKPTRGSILRAAACLMMVALLFVLLSAERNITPRIEPNRQEPVLSRAEPVNLRLRSESAMAVLFCDLTAQDDADKPAMLMLAVVDAKGVLRGLTLPPQTRVLADELDENGECVSSTYVPLADAYVYGSACGLGFENLQNSVSRLLGGLPIDGCVALGSKGIEMLIDSLGGIGVRSNHYSAMLSSGVAGGGGEEAVHLDGQKANAYMRSANRDVDTGALARQQEVFLTIYSLLNAREANYTIEELLEDTQPWFWSNLSGEDAARFGRAFFGNPPKTLEILWGENRIIDGIPYRLPDKEAIKEFVLDCFYPATDDETL